MDTREYAPIYLKSQLAQHLTTFENPAWRMTASVDGWWPQIEQRIMDACRFYKIPIPYWISGTQDVGESAEDFGV